jgi:hypothetical protein
MKLQKNKTLAAIAITMILTLTVFTSSVQFASSAVTEWNTFAYVMAFPDPVGIGQKIVVSLQIDKVNPLAEGVSGGEHFRGFSCKITKPDGTTESKGPFESAAMSGAWFYYIPTMAGKYTFQTIFDGQWVNASYKIVGPFNQWQNVSAPLPYITEQRWYKPSVSAPLELVVQQNPIPSYTDIPLPTGYWQRPIYAENKGWNQIADNWLMQGYDYDPRFFSGSPAFAPYTSAPNSAHVLWKKPIMLGGIIGGPYGDKTYYTGLSYEQHYTPLILNGRIIYAEHYPSSAADGSIYGTRSIDLYTGEEVWFQEDTIIEFAQVYDYESPNEHGGVPHLWSIYDKADPFYKNFTYAWNNINPINALAPINATWRMYDAFTGKHILSIANIPQGYTVFGPSGELLSYSFTPGRDRLVMWNSTRVLTGPGAIAIGPTSVNDTYSPAAKVVYDGQRGIQWSVPIADVPGAQSIAMIGEGVIIAGSVDTSVYPIHYTDVAYDATTGEQLWVREDYSDAAYFRRTRNLGDGVYARFDEANMQFHGYNARTGEELWVTDPLTEGFGYFTYLMNIAYGKLFATGYDGYVRAYDIKDGKLLWEHYKESAGYETPYGSWPTYAGFTVADHKLFTTADDHSPDSVIWRGGKLWAVDTETGKGVWNISGWFRHPAVADGLLTALNSLDGQVYTFGKGPSKTTVQAPLTAVPRGAAVTIVGTVTDQSPGQKGTPAISDDGMSPWMEYLHMQKPIPGDVKGVSVILSAIGPDGKTTEIGTATSEISGKFGFAWTPPGEGLYKITATFAGSNSYGGSFDETFVNVGSQSSSGSAALAVSSDVFFAVIAVVVIAIVILAFVVLRKRK